LLVGRRGARCGTRCGAPWGASYRVASTLPQQSEHPLPPNGAASYPAQATPATPGVNRPFSMKASNPRLGSCLPLGRTKLVTRSERQFARLTSLATLNVCHRPPLRQHLDEQTASLNRGMAAKPHKSCRPRSTSRLGRAPTFHSAFLGIASESGPGGRRAAHLRSEAGWGHARVVRLTPPRERSDQRKRARGRQPSYPGGLGTHQG
jgi:hypothetical protein